MPADGLGSAEMIHCSEPVIHEYPHLAQSDFKNRLIAICRIHSGRLEARSNTYPDDLAVIVFWRRGRFLPSWRQA